MQKQSLMPERIIEITYERPVKRRSVWFWVGLQVSTGIISGAVINIFHVHYGAVGPFHWITIIGLLYWQLRSAKMIGIDIIVEFGLFKKWNVIRIGDVKHVGIIYKTAVGRRGFVILSVWPFVASRWKIANSLQFLSIKFAVWARIIK
jgi:hypothetical protein